MSRAESSKAVELHRVQSFGLLRKTLPPVDASPGIWIAKEVWPVTYSAVKNSCVALVSRFLQFKAGKGISLPFWSHTRGK